MSYDIIGVYLVVHRTESARLESILENIIVPGAVGCYQGATGSGIICEFKVGALSENRIVSKDDVGRLPNNPSVPLLGGYVIFQGQVDKSQCYGQLANTEILLNRVIQNAEKGN